MNTDPPEDPEPKPEKAEPSKGGSFWVELKRRKVTRVAITYAVVAWVLMQVTSIVFPQFGIPDWAGPLVTLLLMIGFPIALIITWAFELTPDGLKTTKSAIEEREGKPVSAKQQQRRNYSSVLFAAGLPTLIFGSLALFFYLKLSGGDASGIDDKSIAVLPFTAFSTEEEERFFADGLSDTLLHKLAQLSGIRVISRSSSFQYRGDSVDVRKVGEELDVATVLEGSVQRSGDRLRIIAQLINTEDGGHIWSKTFDRSSEDTFAIHDEIAEAVVDSLRVVTTDDEVKRLEYNGTSSVEAYTLLTLLRERSNVTEGFNLEPEDFEAQQLELIVELEKVLEIDPNYAEVYRVEAELYNGILFRGAGDSRDYYIRKGFEAVRQAMLLEPKNPYNLVVYANLARRDSDLVTAETFARLAQSDLPNDKNATLVLFLSLYEQNKNAEECLALVEKEESLGGDDFTWRRKWFALSALGRNDEALETVLSALRGSRLLQIAAGDLSFLQSGTLGRHVDTMRELIAFRKRLGDSGTGAFWSAWLRVAGRVRMEEEVRKVLANAPPAQALANQVPIYWAQGKHQEALDWLDEKGWGWHLARAKNHMALGNFEAAAEEWVNEKENLESRHGKHPYLVNRSDFLAALSLTVCFRKTGETEAASRLFDEARDFVASRTVNGVFPTFEYDQLIYYALNGETANALEELKRRVYLEGDDFVPLGDFQSFSMPEFDSIRDDESFQESVAEYERRLSASRETIRALLDEAGY